MYGLIGTDHTVIAGPIYISKTTITLERATVRAKQDLSIPGVDRSDHWDEWQIVCERAGQRRTHSVHESEADGLAAFAEHQRQADAHAQMMQGRD